jgi:vacuolar-type H+-ATPase subunit H
MDKSLVTVVFIAVAAETPNKLLLKAKQEAYELVTQQAKDLLKKQRKSYEDQCARMAEEHQKCMERMRKQSDKMLEEATKVRQAGVCAGIPIRRNTLHPLEKSKSLRRTCTTITCRSKWNLGPRGSRTTTN